MAVDVKNVAIGGAVVLLGDWVTAGGAGSLNDVGLLAEGSEITFTREVYELKSDSAMGVLRAVPTDMGVEVKMIMQEATLDNLRRVTSQVTGSLTGTAPNKTLLFGEYAEQYHQATVATKGPMGPTSVAGTETWTFWKLYIKNVETLAFKKGQEQRYAVTFGAAEDLTVTTADKFCKVVVASAA